MAGTSRPKLRNWRPWFYLGFYTECPRSLNLGASSHLSFPTIHICLSSFWTRQGATHANNAVDERDVSGKYEDEEVMKRHARQNGQGRGRRGSCMHVVAKFAPTEMSQHTLSPMRSLQSLISKRAPPSHRPLLPIFSPDRLTGSIPLCTLTPCPD